MIYFFSHFDHELTLGQISRIIETIIMNEKGKKCTKHRRLNNFESLDIDIKILYIRSF